jgi:hypothetical protein
VDGAVSRTSATKKAELQRWLQQNHPEADQESMMKAALLAICRQLGPKPADE